MRVHHVVVVNRICMYALALLVQWSMHWSIHRSNGPFIGPMVHSSVHSSIQRLEQTTMLYAWALPASKVGREHAVPPPGQRLTQVQGLPPARLCYLCLLFTPPPRITPAPSYIVCFFLSRFKPFTTSKKHACTLSYALSRANARVCVCVCK